jgi:hypothetical protein
MMAAKNAFYEFPAVMRNIPHFFYGEWGVEVPFYLDKITFIEFNLSWPELRFEYFWITDQGSHPAHNGFICPKKVQKRKGNNQDKTRQEAGDQKGYFPCRQQFLITVKLNSFEEIEKQEDGRQDDIVDAVFQKGFRGGSQEPEMPAEKNKGGDIPAHEKNAHGASNNRGTEGVYVTQIFRRQEKCVSPKGPHKTPIDSAE